MNTMTRHEGPSRAASLMAAVALGKKVPADAINLLITDHRQVAGWFDAYGGLEPAGKLALVRQICTALKAHALIEEELFYPEVRQATGDDDLIDHGLKEHGQAMQMISELERMTEAGREMDSLVRKLSAAIADHVEEEEQELFPEVRKSNLDTVVLGARLSALRMAAFAEITGRGTTELDRHPPVPFLAPNSLVEPEAARATFVRSLRDAHAMEKQSELILRKEIGRVGNYPDVEQRMQMHLEETQDQIERIARLLDDLGESRSGFKDMAAEVAGWFGQVGLGSTEDEVLKGALASAAFENFEAAAYEQLLAMGELAGETRAIKLLQLSLSEERAMVGWLQQCNASLVPRYLEQSAGAGESVGR